LPLVILLLIAEYVGTSVQSFSERP
jgi:hypothetical protein